mmetsp:Transcript_20070/g.32143  ORF Transcript_20070/g.32143 Transcript_20070/m.32143 type:complete len:571 (+) Transcript_20070:158-1870(+)
MHATAPLLHKAVTEADAALTAEAAAATTADISNALILDTKSIKDRHKSLRDTGNGVKGGGLETQRGQTKEKSEKDKQATKTAEEQLVKSLEDVPKDRSIVHGWLSKLNAKGVGANADDWRERLCFSVDGVLSYISEKKAGEIVKVCDLINSAGIVMVSYPESNHENAFMLHFFDGSCITFAAHSEMDTEKWTQEVLRVLQENHKHFRSISERTGVRLEVPPYLATKNVVSYSKNTNWGWIMGHLHGWNINQHESLFWFGSRGKHVLLHLIKLVLFVSCVNISLFFIRILPMILEIEWSPLGPLDHSLIREIATWSLRAGLGWSALMFPYLTLKPMPVCIGYLNLTTCIEMMKKDEEILEVMKTQKSKKHHMAIKVLASLQYFLEQSELSVEGAQLEHLGATEEVNNLFAKLTKDPDLKKYCDDTLKVKFEQFDADGSNDLDRVELGNLLDCMGQSKSEEELDRLFNLMDADGGGSVDFEEFATVMLYNRRKGRRDVKPNVLAEKLFKLFDKEGCGSIDVDDMLEHIQQMGKNWDMADVRAFLDEIDNDGSGCIVKSDFISYVEKYMGEQR